MFWSSLSADVAMFCHKCSDLGASLSCYRRFASAESLWFRCNLTALCTCSIGLKKPDQVAFQPCSLPASTTPKQLPFKLVRGVCVCMCMCVSVCVYLCVCVCICVYVCACICVYVCVYLCALTCACAHMCAACACKRACVCANTRARG